MSGRWSRACDEQSVGDSHRSPARSAQLALTWITHALIAIEDGEDPSLHIARAGAHVRAWRKSLPEQGEREAPGWFPSADIQVAAAGQDVLRATMPAASSGAFWLRSAEADLRGAWKQATR